jgi:MFS family permease
MQGLAQAWVVLDLTGSAVALGTVIAIQFAPILVLSLFSGPLADRFPKRRFLMGLQAAAVVQAATFATLVFTGHVQLWEVYVLAAMLGIFNAIDNPTRQSFVSEIVPPAEIHSAVGLNSSVNNAARIVGPSIGGVIIATWGTGWCFALNAAGFAVAFACLWAMRQRDLRPPAIAAAGRMHHQVLAGLRYVASERSLLVPVALLGLIGSLGYNWAVTLPLLARYTYAAGPTGFGLLNAALGAGSLIGGLLVASRPPSSPVRLALIALGFSAMLMGLALAPTFELALALLMATGCLGVFFSAGVNVVIQLRSRPEFRGRVLGLFFLVWAGGTPIGAALTGNIAAIADIRFALAINAALCAIGSAIAAAYLLRRGPRADPVIGRDAGAVDGVAVIAPVE